MTVDCSPVESLPLKLLSSSVSHNISRELARGVCLKAQARHGLAGLTIRGILATAERKHSCYKKSLLFLSYKHKVHLC